MVDTIARITVVLLTAGIQSLADGDTILGAKIAE